MRLRKSIFVISLALILLYHVLCVLLILFYYISLHVSLRPLGKEPFHTKPPSYGMCFLRNALTLGDFKKLIKTFI